MVLPVVADYVLEDCLVDLASTDIDGEVFVIVMGLKQFGYGVDRVSIKLLYSRRGESHGDNSGRNISQIKVKPVFPEPHLWPSYQLP